MFYKLLLFTCLIGSSLLAKADLLVSPTRIIFGERERVKEVILINTGNVKRSYRIEWSEKTVSKTGQYLEIDEETPEFAVSPFVRFSPRQVSLQPGERQVIKLLIRKNNQMDLDEYRSHLRFFALPIETELPEQSEVSGMALRLDVLTSYTIPILYRTIEVKPQVNIVSVDVKKNAIDKTEIFVTLNKKSSTSIIGSLFAYITDKDTGNRIRVGELNSVQMLHETEQTLVKIIWRNFDKYLPYNGNLEIEYIGNQEFTGLVFDRSTSNISI